MPIPRFAYSQVLSSVREADYAHPGEEAGIERVLRHLEPQTSHTVLDVGCGLGGTASYMAAAGYGKVVGVDPDEASIAYARSHYEAIEFHPLSAMEVANLGRTFDVITLINVAYLVPSKQELFTALSGAARPGTRLVVSDFIDHHGTGERIKVQGTTAVPYPLEATTVTSLLGLTGWQLKTLEDLSPAYAHWYTLFVQRIMSHETEILQTAGAEAYEYLIDKYSRVREAVVDNQLGGGIIAATYAESAVI